MSVKRRMIRFGRPPPPRRVALGLVVLAVAGTIIWFIMLRMPGKSYRGPLPPLTQHQLALRDQLRTDVEELAGRIGQRNIWHDRDLAAAADFIEAALSAAGYTVHRQSFEVQQRTCHNLEAEIPGTDRADQIVIVGAHYDSVLGTPGANDNASGVAALLALARAMAGKATSRTLRFVAFVNEEQPFYRTGAMGSVVYARRCRQRNEKVVAMLSLETIGYYCDAEGSQRYPFPFDWLYPSTGNFIAFVGNVSSRGLVRQVVGSFRRHAKFPSEGGAVPGSITGVGWSDHWAFWQEGYPAVMVTDTALFRYPHYHSPADTPDKLNYDGLARVVDGLIHVVADLAGPAE